MKRRDLLLSGALAASGAFLDAEARRKHKRKKRKKRRKPEHRRDVAGMNVILFITDQERAIQHFPPGWAEKNLKAATRLERHGLTFNRAFCSACMCSPSRATMLTGYFPAQHGVKYTLEESMPADQYPQVELPLDLPNIASVMSAAGYHVPYKGKWHLSKPIGGDWAPQDVGQYGFQRWDPPDAGANQDLDQFGGGNADNDGRFMEDDGPVAAGEEGVLEYLESLAAQQQPFFLIVSLVNPHDVLAYPKVYIEGGYNNSVLLGNIGLPATVNEDLSTKPTAQRAALTIMDVGLGPLPTDQDKRNYLNFYGNLMKASDKYLEDILDTLEDKNLLDNTLLIKTSDHGEVGLAHNGMRQKIFNVYEETLRVPLVYSNPKLFPRPVQSQAMVSHVDLLPTLASLFKTPASARVDWQGVDYSQVVLHPETTRDVQDYTVFTYDDFQAGQPTGPYVPPPQHIISIREVRYKLAKYYDVDGNLPDQWEMYDLLRDPLETQNIAFRDFPRTPEQEAELLRLQAKLAEVEQTRLRPLSSTPRPQATGANGSTGPDQRKRKRKRKQKRRRR